MKRKALQKLIALTVVFVLMFCLGACGSKDSDPASATKATSEDESESGNESTGTEKFVVGFDAAFPPYGYLDENGEYVGFDLDLAEEVCERNNWEFVKQPLDWNSKDMELDSGTVSCLWNGFTMSEDRLDKYTWSEPYVDNSQVIVVHKDSGIQKLSDLAGKTVVVQEASSALEALQSDDCKDLLDSFATLDQVPDYNQAFMYLESGGADAIAMDIGVANFQIANKGDDFVILKEAVITEQYAIGFKLGNEELRYKVQNTLNEMVEDGTFDKIAEKWDLSEEVCLGKDK